MTWEAYLAGILGGLTVVTCFSVPSLIILIILLRHAPYEPEGHQP